MIPHAGRWRLAKTTRIPPNKPSAEPTSWQSPKPYRTLRFDASRTKCGKATSPLQRSAQVFVPSSTSKTNIRSTLKIPLDAVLGVAYLLA